MRERLQQARSAHQSELCNQLKVQEQRLRFELGKGWKAEKETLMAQHRVRASLSLSLSPCTLSHSRPPLLALGEGLAEVGGRCCAHLVGSPAAG